MKKYKHIFFDFDGVISNSTKIAIAKYQKIRNNHFPQLPLIEGKEGFNLVYSGLLKSSLDKWLGLNKSKDFFDLHSNEMKNSVNDIHVYDGIVELLNNLNDKSYSIITSSYSSAVINILTKDTLFDSSKIYKISGRELMKSKTEKIEQLLDELNLSKSEVIYVGDLESDIIYCKAVPIDIISVGYGYQTYDYLINKGATYTVRTLKDLKQLINKL
jgi:phosphoglycolate phosphatase